MLPLILALLLLENLPDRTWDTKQGQTLIIQLTPEECAVDTLALFGQKYQCTQDSHLIIGTHFEQAAGSYNLISYGRDIRSLGIVHVSQTAFELQTRIRRSRPPTTSTKRREQERRTISYALIAGEEKYPNLKAPNLAKPPLRDVYVSGDPFGLLRQYQTPKGQLLGTDHHRGVDLGTARRIGLPVYAIADGVVALAGQFSAEGNLVILYHGNGIYSLYMHLNRLLVKIGARVLIGDKIATSGNTGSSSGPHLHLAIKINGAVVDPLQFIELLERK